MKKLLIAAVTSAMLSSTVLAEGMENSFYGKVNVGASMLTKFNDKDTGVKLKSKTNAFAGIGVGYYLMDNIRADLTFDHFFNPELKKSGTGTANGFQGDKLTVKHKANIDALLLNGFVDIDVSMVKLFVGVGVGAAQISDKQTIDGTDAASGIKFDTITGKSKRRTTVAYAVHAGAAMDVSEGLIAEVAYSYRDFGKTKKSDTLDSHSFKGHQLAGGLRVVF